MHRQRQLACLHKLNTLESKPDCMMCIFEIKAISIDKLLPSDAHLSTHAEHSFFLSPKITKKLSPSLPTSNIFGQPFKLSSPEFISRMTIRTNIQINLVFRMTLRRKE